jgi:hypothetical protein
MSGQGSFVAGLRVATPQEAAKAKAASGLTAAAMAPTVAPPPLDVAGELAAAAKPGKPPLNPGSVLERWPVKVGTDDDVKKVKPTGVIVDTTVAELGKLKSPPTWPNQKKNPPVALQKKRFAPTETTVWRVKAQIIAFRLEADGDFHVELKTPDGVMNVELPLPKPPFVPAKSPFATDIRNVRRAFIDAFKTTVAQKAFAVAPSGMLAPVDMLPEQSFAAAATRHIDLSLAFDSDQVHPFVMMVPPRAATITGVGFFDKEHGQANNSPNIIELHPVLDIKIA